MHYSYEVEVTPSDTASSPVVFPIKLAAGVITDVSFLFDVGDGFSTCVCLWNRANQILPTNPEGFYSADGQLITAKLWYDMSTNDNDLFVIAWNRGGLYGHTVTIMIDVRGPDEPDVYSLQNGLIDVINRLVDLMRSVF